MGLVDFLSSVDDEFNRVAKHNCNFKFIQTVRLLSILASGCLWCVLLFIWAKASFAQLQFWILCIWIYSISIFALSAGREVCEIKMLRKL